LGKKSFPDKYLWGVAVVTVAVIYFTNIHPAFLIAAAMLFGWLMYGRAKRD
jgi:chromate transporter